MDNLRILQTSQADQLDESGKLRQRVRVKWMAGDDGPYVDFFDREGFDPDVARQAIQRRADEFRRLRG